MEKGQVAGVLFGCDGKGFVNTSKEMEARDTNEIQKIKGEEISRDIAGLL